MRRWTKITIAMLLSLLVSPPAGGAWAAGSKTHVVRPGESIQAAIDAARPGDTILVKPGKYTEALAITTDNLTLKGSRGTVLVPPASADNLCVTLFEGAIVGICAHGEINLDTFEVIDPLEGPRISGFVVKGFGGSGILALGTEDLRATHNWAKDNTGYGIFAILSTHPVLAYNKTNTTWDNSIGIFLRDVSHGTAEGNQVFGNCSGILLLAGAPGPLTNWKIRRNLVRANKTDCGEEDPVPSGMGILLLGAADNDISKNLVLRNRGEGIEGQGGGIVLVTGGEPGGPQFEPSGNTVRKNVAFRNQPFDISWDGTGSGVVFKGNRCATSEPEGLCD